MSLPVINLGIDYGDDKGKYRDVLLQKRGSERPYRADHQLPLKIQGQDRGGDRWNGRHPPG